MASPIQELSTFNQKKLLRDVDLIAKRQIWIIIATAVVFVIAVTATILAGFALSFRDLTSDENVLKVSSSSHAVNYQGDYGCHPNETETAFIAQRTSDLEAKINATNVLLTNLLDKEEQMKEQISSLTNELAALRNYVANINTLGIQSTSSTIQPTPTQTSGTSSSSTSFKAEKYVATVSFFVFLCVYIVDLFKDGTSL